MATLGQQTDGDNRPLSVDVGSDEVSRVSLLHAGKNSGPLPVVGAVVDVRAVVYDHHFQVVVHRTRAELLFHVPRPGEVARETAARLNQVLSEHR